MLHGILWGLITAVVCLAAFILVALPKLAKAQTLEEGRAWIHVNGRECCPHRNCFPAPGAAVGPEGWKVPGMSGSIPPTSGKAWPFKGTWACYYPNDPAKTLKCVFHPHPEAS